jgi:hypothetical protein
MNSSAEPRARRIDVPDEPPAGMGRYDYADAFEIRVPEPDPRSAEQFARDAIEGAPWPARTAVLVAWQHVLRFRLGPRPSPDHVIGAQIVRSEPDMVQLAMPSPLLDGVIVGRKVDGVNWVVATYLSYRRPRTAHVVWAVLSPLHRWLARYLMEHAAVRRYR